MAAHLWSEVAGSDDKHRDAELPSQVINNAVGVWVSANKYILTCYKIKYSIKYLYLFKKQTVTACYSACSFQKSN